MVVYPSNFVAICRCETWAVLDSYNVSELLKIIVSSCRRYFQLKVARALGQLPVLHCHWPIKSSFSCKRFIHGLLDELSKPNPSFFYLDSLLFGGPTISSMMACSALQLFLFVTPNAELCRQNLVLAAISNELPSEITRLINTQVQVLLPNQHLHPGNPRRRKNFL